MPDLPPTSHIRPDPFVEKREPSRVVQVE